MWSAPQQATPQCRTALTGITDEMVAGKRIDEAVVSAFVKDALIVIDRHCA
jgi:DNA polymerase-3 subunit epsilon